MLLLQKKNLHLKKKELNDKNKKRLALLQDYFSVLTDPNNTESRDIVDKKVKEDLEKAEEKKQIDLVIEQVRRDILSSESPNVIEEQIVALAGISHPFGIFNSEKIDKLETSVNNYLQFIAENENDFVNHDALKETLIKIVDFKALKGRAEDYDKAISFIMSPGKLSDLADKFTIKFRELYIENKKEIRSRMEKYVDQTEKIAFLNALATLDVYPSLQETEKWLKGKGPIPSRFFLSDREVSPLTDKKLYGKIEAALGTYENAARKKDADIVDIEDQEQADEFEDIQDDEHNYDDNFIPETDEETGEVIEEDIDFESSVSLGKQYLTKKYREYQKNAKGTPMSYIDWRENSISKQARKISIAINKLSQEVFGPAFAAGEKDTFEEWLIKNEELEEVQNILKHTGLTLNQIIDKKAKVPTKLNPDKVKPRQTIIDPEHSSGIHVQESTQTFDGVEKKVFRLVDNNNEPIQDQPYGTLEEAEGARNKKVRETKKDSSYDFGKESGLKKGIIIENKETGEKFMVMSQKKNVDKHNNLWLVPSYDITAKRTFIDEEDFNKNYKIVIDEIIEDDVIVAKLLPREPLQIFPKKNYSIKKEKDRNADANKTLQDLLLGLSPLKQAGIRIRIRYGPKWDTRMKDPKKLKSFEGVREKDIPNENIKIQKQKLWIEIMSEDKTIGFFQGTSASVLLDNKGVPINPLEITKQQANDLFRRFKKRSGKGYTVSIEDLVSQIKYNYTQAIAIEEAFQKLLENAKADEVIVNISDLENIGVTLSEGELAKVEGADRGASGVTFGELDYKFVNQNENNEDVTTDGGRPFFVMDYSRNYPTKDKNGKFYRVKGNPINNINTNTPEGKKLFREINQVFAKYESKASNLKGKYIALVNLPNGKSALVQLKPDTMQAEDVDSLLNTMKARSKDTV